jgi:hypothetical protein
MPLRRQPRRLDITSITLVPNRSDIELMLLEVLLVLKGMFNRRTGYP